MLNILKNDGVYVVHALKGYEVHERRIIELFDKIGLSYQFVTDGDPTHFTERILNKYFVPDIKSIMPPGILSCTLNHFYAYEKMVEKNQKYALIFENDPYFLGDFMGKVGKIIPEIEKLESGFIVSLENSTLRFPSFWDSKKNKHLYQATSGRMAGAYIIDLEGAKRILKEMENTKCYRVIDWWHNIMANKNLIKIYWAHPPLVEQGSHNGRMNSTISRKPNTFTRRLKWVFLKNYKMLIRRLFNEKRIVK